jgi:cytochrome c
MISKLNWMAPATVLLLAACGGNESNADDNAAANPCAAAMADNPCAAAMAANPCAAGMDKTLPVDAIRQGDKKLSANGKTMQQLVDMGTELWSDPSLSGGGATSCATCHTGDGTAMMNATFDQPYPHMVAMAKEKAGLETVNAAEMVQLCMAIPMNAKPLDYGSVELAALTAYVTELHANARGASALHGDGGMNPCAANPCGAGMNPCAANPCAANPCAAKMNPCGANPCAAGMNPCAAAKNPCGGM